MSGNKNKGFSQTSKRYDGDLKAQHQQSRSHQLDPKHSEEMPSADQSDKGSSSVSSSSKKNQA